MIQSSCSDIPKDKQSNCTTTKCSGNLKQYPKDEIIFVYSDDSEVFIFDDKDNVSSDGSQVIIKDDKDNLTTSFINMMPIIETLGSLKNSMYFNDNLNERLNVACKAAAFLPNEENKTNCFDTVIIRHIGE